MGAAEKTVESTQLKTNRAQRLSFVSVVKFFLPSAAKLRVQGCGSSLSLRSGDCVRVNTGQSLSLSSEREVLQTWQGELHVHRVTSFSKLAHGGTELPPSTVTMDRRGFLGAANTWVVMSWLCRRDFLCV